MNGRHCISGRTSRWVGLWFMVHTVFVLVLQSHRVEIRKSQDSKPGKAVGCLASFPLSPPLHLLISEDGVQWQSPHGPGAPAGRLSPWTELCACVWGATDAAEPTSPGTAAGHGLTMRTRRGTDSLCPGEQRGTPHSSHAGMILWAALFFEMSVSEVHASGI